MNKNKASELKGLQTQMQELSGKLSSLEVKKVGIDGEIKNMRHRISMIKKMMNEITKNDNFIISEHVLLRYIERVIGIDLEEIRNNILNEKDIERIKALGNCTYPKEGFKVVIKNNTAVTLIADKKGD